MSETYGQYEARALRETISSLAAIVEDKTVLQISVRSNYGAPAIYPANEAARIFADIAGTKTLKVDTLAKAKRLGFRIEQVADPAAQLIYMPAVAALVGA